MPAVKKNHHYVPQFWLRGFADAKGQIHAWDGQQVRVVSSKRIMQGDWLYTLFDNAWQPTDALEDALAQAEGLAAPIFAKLAAPAATLTTSERQELWDFLALQACRHPDIMKRAHRRARDLGALIVSVRDFQSEHDFVVEAATFAIPASVAQGMYALLLTQDPARLQQEYDELIGLSPQDAQLPEQEALRAQAQIATAISAMTLTLLDAPAGSAFVLGDTPMPQDRLGHGFTVPLSQTVAVMAQPSTTSQTATTRRVATPGELAAINQTQWDNALHIVIGPDPLALRAL
ncbi:MAG: DUF4238 domain-containing protein [Betaproteobacteria bacterium]|nr:DUF4238 domain-containing protein [Betaproteobacteria bacterium]